MMVLSIIALVLGILFSGGGYYLASQSNGGFCGILWWFVVGVFPGGAGTALGGISYILASFGFAGGWIAVPIVGIIASCSGLIYAGFLKLFS